ncbi:MAG: YncE family protein [Taibaiella sp.]|nr:YncE family protein [Taibaiella sp.]
MKAPLFIALAAATFSVGPNHVYAQSSGYKVVNTLHIQSAGKWDYVAINPVSSNVYLSHGTQVNVLNSKGDSVGIINNTTGVHGIAFAPAYRKGFTSNGRINTVTVFDIKTNEVSAQVKTGENPDAIMYDPYSKKIVVCNGRSKDLTIIDPSNNAVVATIALGGKPETAVSDEKGKIYVDIEDKNEIVVVDIKTMKAVSRWSVGKGDEPAGLAIDLHTHRLFAGCGNKLLVVVNADNGKIVDNITIGDGCDGVAFDPALKHIYASNGEGTLSLIKEISPDKYLLIENIPTKKGARTLAVDPKTHHIYLPTADFKPLVAGEKRPDMVPGTFQVLVVGK